MAQIYADINQMNEAANQLLGIINSLNEMKNSVRTVGSQISSSSRLMTTTKRKVIDSADDILELVFKVNVLRITVLQAAEIYSKTENNIVSNAGGEIQQSQKAKEYGEQVDQILDTLSSLIAAIMDKSKAIGKLIEMIMPYIVGGVIGVLTNGVSNDRPDMGYIIEKDKVTAWLKKREWSNEDGTLNGSAHVGKVEINNKLDGAIGKVVSKKEKKDGKWEEKEYYQLLYGEFDESLDFELFGGEGNVGVGTDFLGLEGQVNGSVGNVEIGGKGQVSIGEDGINAYAGVQAIVSAVEGKASATVNVLGFEITFSATGYAGAAGGEAEVGFKNGKFVAEVGAAAVIGGGVGIEIGLNDLGVDTIVDSFKQTGELIYDGVENLIDSITFWD